MPGKIRRMIDVDFRKWVSRPHWRFAMYFLDEDEWGTWLWSPPGSTARRAAEPVKTFNHLNVKLIIPGEWWTAIWNDAGRYDLYVDVITPPAWNNNRVTMIDLDLDIVRLADDRVVVTDEDEFSTHQRTYGYPPPVIDKTRRVTSELHDRIGRGEEPFGAVGKARMKEAAELGSSRLMPS